MNDHGEDVTVLYHGGGCRDGFCAAWCMRRAFPKAEFHAVNYGEDMPDVTGRRVFFVDFCPTEGQLRGFCRTNPEVTVLDHHEQAESVLAAVRADNLCVTFAAGKSGARLAWEYVAGLGKWDRIDGPPWLVLYTEDRDLWRWALPESRAVNAAIRLRELDFEAWDRLAAMDPLAIAADGRLILWRDAEIVGSHVRHAVPVRVGDHTVPGVNATTLISEIGNELSKGHPFSATYFDDLKAGVRRWSLRSQAGGANVTEIAKRLGGGGHPSGRAAGFQQPLTAEPPR